MKDENENKECEPVKELSFAERMNLKPEAKQCKCGKSKKYPLCDGSHSQE